MFYMHLEEIIFSNKTQTYIMKKLIFMFLAIIMVAGLTSTIKAQTQYQAKATTTAGAEIVAAISISSSTPLNFGKMSSPSSAADVILSTARVLTTTNSSAISLFPTTATNALYSVSGTTGYNYSIIFPGNDLVKIESGSNSMYVNDFKALPTSKGSEGITGTLISGSDTFVVGATLKIKSGQATGAYTGNFDVIVSYN